MMTRTLRPRNSLQKAKPDTFDESPPPERQRRSIGRKTRNGLKDEKALTDEDAKEGEWRVTTTDDSSELIKEQNKEEDEIREKEQPQRTTRGRPRGRPRKIQNNEKRGRPRGRPRKIQNNEKRPRGRPRKIQNNEKRGRPRGRPRKIQSNEKRSLLQTEGNDNVNRNQDGLKNASEKNCVFRTQVVGKTLLRKKDQGEDGSTKLADVDSNEGEIASRLIANSRKRKRKDDEETIKDVVMETGKVTTKRSKRRKKTMAGEEEYVDDLNRKKTSNTKQSKSSPLPDSLSGKISEKDYHEFQEVIAMAEVELKESKAVTCPSCNKMKSKSLPNLLRHLRYFCCSYVKPSGVSHDCTLCNRKCRSLATLDQHMKTVHSKSNPLQCKSPETLTKPEFSKLCKQQGGRVKCPKPECGRTFTTLEGVKYHVPRCGVQVKATLKCEYCQKVYASKPGLSFHMNAYHTQTKLSGSSSEETTDPSGKRGAAAKALKKLHQIVVDGEVQDPTGNDNALLSEMAACSMIKDLFTSPAKYEPTPADLDRWKLEFSESGRASCPFCKKSLAAIKFVKAHVSTCRSRLGREPFCCLTCKAELNSRQQILKHLRASHEELVTATLEKARKDEENKWEAEGGDGEDEEEFNEDEELDLEEEESETEEEKPVQERRKTKRFRNRFDGTKIDNSYKHVIVQVLKATDWTKKFRAKNFCPQSRTLFPDWNVDISNWKSISQSDAATYHPHTKESAMFVIEKRKGRLRKGKTEALRLPLYGALPVEKGGPVWAMAWCPVPDDAPLARSYVAVSCYLEMDHTEFFAELEPSPSLIQIWDLGVLKSKTTTTPRMVLGVAHDHGNTNGIQWCPSGGYEPVRHGASPQDPQRLGLLAIACSEGFVCIYSIPHPKEEQNIHKPDPVITLKPTRLDQWFGQCLCVDWSQNQGHSRIVAGFGNGAVAVWNLQTTSSLLIEETNGGKFLYPSQVLYACTNAVIAVSLNPNDDNYLLVCSIDRATSMWDVRFPSCPMDEINFSTAFDCHWPLHYQLGMVSTESHSTGSKGSVVHLFDPGQQNSHFTELTLHTSVWSFSISDWLHCIAGGADDGQVAINIYTVPSRLYKSSSRLKQRILTEITMEAKPSQLSDKLAHKQQALTPSEKKVKAVNMSENFAKDEESCDGHDALRKMGTALSGDESNKEIIVAEAEVKGHGGIQPHNGTDGIRTKFANEEVKDGSLNKGGESKVLKEMRTAEKVSKQSSRELISNSEGENLNILNFGETMCETLSRTDVKDDDSQNVSVENKSLEETLVGRPRQSEDEVDSAKLHEIDVDETGRLSEGFLETLSDEVDGVGHFSKRESGQSSIQVSGNVQVTGAESLIPQISGNSFENIEKTCSSSLNEGNEVTGNTFSTKETQLKNNHRLGVNTKEVDVKNSDGKGFVGGEDENNREDKSSEPLKNGAPFDELPQDGSCESVEVPMAITAKIGNLNSLKIDEESSAITDEDALNESNIESLDSQINELISNCHSTLEDLQETVTLCSESDERPSTNERKGPPKKSKHKKKVEEKKLCIMDEEFDIHQVFGDCEKTEEDENEIVVEEDKDTLRAKVKAWRPKYAETEASKFVLYKDYLEPVYASPTWIPVSKKALARKLETSKTNSTDFLLNAVNRVAWSPNYQSCRWLLVAGNNGIVRALHMNCLEPSRKMKQP